MKAKSNNIKASVMTAVFASLIAVMTAFIKVPTGINEGYIHFGDSFIYLASCMLGPYSIIAASLGGAVADIISGAAVWAIPTAIIKACNCLPFYFLIKKSNADKITCPVTIIASVLSGIITVFGYFVAEGLMYSFASAITSVPFSIIQGIGSCVVFALVGVALDAVKIKKQIKRLFR